MSVNTGLNSWLGLESESVHGTDPATARDWLRIVSCALDPVADKTAGNRSVGIMAKSGVRLFNRRFVADPKLDMYYQGAELLLWSLLGGKATSGVGPYTHTFTPSLSGRMVGMTVELQKDNIKSIGTGGKVTKADLKFDQENLEISFGLTTKHGTQTVATSSPTFPSAPEITALEATDATKGLIFKLNSTAEDIKSGALSITLPHTEDRSFVGNPDMEEQIINDYLTAEGSLVRELADTAYFTKYDAGSTHVLEFNYMSEDETPTYPGNNYEFRVKLFAARIVDVSAPVEGPDAITETIQFQAERDSSGNILEIVCVNERVTVP